MDKFSRIKTSQIIAYVLQETGGVDIYHLFKILYFAEMKHLAKYGCGFIDDDFHALPYGPVPTHIYDAIKNKGELAEDMNKVYKYGQDDANNTMIGVVAPDMDYISESEKSSLDASISENSPLKFEELYNKSHDAAYHIAAQKRQPIISKLDMAKVAGANEGFVEYIKEMSDIETALA